MKKYVLTTAMMILLFGTTINLKSSTQNSIESIETQLKELKEKLYEKNIFSEYNMVKYFNEEERAKAHRIAERFNQDLNNLCLLFHIESRGNPKAVNKHSNATGLIQWLPSTAKRFETTVSEIHNMSVSEQLDLVEKYLEFWEPEQGYKDFTDLYLAVFSPSALGKSNNYIIGAEGSKAVVQNTVVDGNKDGILTVADVKNFIS